MLFFLTEWNSSLAKRFCGTIASGSLVLMILSIWQFCQFAFAQESPNTGPFSSDVVLVSLSPPSYPPIARTAHIIGDVKINLLIKKDGSIESVYVLSGSPLLTQAAMDSAKQSKFECRGCSEEPSPYTLTYTYQISGKAGPCCCSGPDNGPPHGPSISQSGNHIDISAEELCICPDECTTKWAEDHSKYRALKCLYLWKCGNHHYKVM